MKSLKKYQEEVVDNLVMLSKMCLKTDRTETVVLQAPTGSGKTFMMTKYMVNLIQNTDKDCCFLWISIGKGELHKQSFKSVKKELNDELLCSLLEEEYFGSKKEIDSNEIVFINWEKIRTKDRVTGAFSNIAMRDGENNSFPEVLANTRNTERNIILIIDESHAGATTERAKEIRDEIIKPNLTIEMSATPVLDDRDHIIKVDPTDVINEGMIKKEILINPSIKEVVEDEMTSEQLILESAYKKREELAQKYKELKIDINPLVLIQLPNSSAGEMKKEAIEKFLASKEIMQSNEKLAVWLSDEKINSESDKLLEKNGTVEFLIFKQAIDTGWDCPRAQILVRFRETNSITFEIQTVGRILRMPEAKHYLDEELNKAFVFTNIKSIAIKKEIYNPNIIKSICSERRKEYTPTPLLSYYRNRIDFGDITSYFYAIFEHVFCETFGIKYVEDDKLPEPYGDSRDKMKQYGVKTQFEDDDEIISNLIIESEKIDKISTIDVQEYLIKIGISSADLEIRYDDLIKRNLNGFAPKRSIPTVKQAILKTFRKYLNLQQSNGGIMYIQNMIIYNENIFSSLISEATEKYKIPHEYEVRAKSDEEFNDEWEIEPSKNYNPNTVKSVDSELSLYQPLYMEVKNGKMDELEVNFIRYLDSHVDKVEWFWKNGSEHMKTNFGIQKEDKSSFQPDFIIKFKDGRIGIFDTKAGNGFNEADNRIKSNALHKYIYSEFKKGRCNLLGGIVIEKSGRFVYFPNMDYKTYETEPGSWKNFDTLFE